MKKKLSLLFLCLFLVVFLVGCGEKGIDSPVRVGGNRVLIKSIAQTSKYTDSMLDSMGKALVPSSQNILIVIKGEISGKVDTQFCSSSKSNIKLKWWDNSRLMKINWIMCGINEDDKTFVIIYTVPKEIVSGELFELLFEKEDVVIRLWKLKYSR